MRGHIIQCRTLLGGGSAFQGRAEVVFALAHLWPQTPRADGEARRGSDWLNREIPRKAQQAYKWTITPEG